MAKPIDVVENLNIVRMLRGMDRASEKARTLGGDLRGLVSDLDKVATSLMSLDTAITAVEKLGAVVGALSDRGVPAFVELTEASDRFKDKLLELGETDWATKAAKAGTFTLETLTNLGVGVEATAIQSRDVWETVLATLESVGLQAEGTTHAWYKESVRLRTELELQVGAQINAAAAAKEAAAQRAIAASAKEQFGGIADRDRSEERLDFIQRSVEGMTNLQAVEEKLWRVEEKRQLIIKEGLNLQGTAEEMTRRQESLTQELSISDAKRAALLVQHTKIQEDAIARQVAQAQAASDLFDQIYTREHAAQAAAATSKLKSLDEIKEAENDLVVRIHMRLAANKFDVTEHKHARLELMALENRRAEIEKENDDAKKKRAEDRKKADEEEIERQKKKVDQFADFLKANREAGKEKAKADDAKGTTKGDCNCPGTSGGGAGTGATGGAAKASNKRSPVYGLGGLSTYGQSTYGGGGLGLGMMGGNEWTQFAKYRGKTYGTYMTGGGFGGGFQRGVRPGEGSGYTNRRGGERDFSGGGSGGGAGSGMAPEDRILNAIKDRDIKQMVVQKRIEALDDAMKSDPKTREDALGGMTYKQTKADIQADVFRRNEATPEERGDAQRVLANAIIDEAKKKGKVSQDAVDGLKKAVQILIQQKAQSDSQAIELNLIKQQLDQLFRQPAGVPRAVKQAVGRPRP